ncbi:hypothetical protein CYMTET_48693 [Cymbomonas tetramitiformis]|uniref:Membrane magnesium transporter n=1 Tax=Cymbomonas tetramitiformis TaxID=36881 RepID=A0AAE0BTE8_9CHLO|nr:hypothetical protein CYMTET_48693 [Cymbomonas tetramitiformis]
MGPLPKFGTFSGFAFLCYAAYSTVNYRNELKMKGVEFDGVPFEVLLQCILGTIACLWGGLQMSGELLPIKSEMNDQCPEQLDFRGDFISLNHRGICLPPKSIE